MASWRAHASRAPQADIARLKASMGWAMAWYTITDSFDADFGVGPSRAASLAQAGRGALLRAIGAQGISSFAAAALPPGQKVRHARLGKIIERNATATNVRRRRMRSTAPGAKSSRGGEIGTLAERPAKR